MARSGFACNLLVILLLPAFALAGDPIWDGKTVIKITPAASLGYSGEDGKEVVISETWGIGVVKETDGDYLWVSSDGKEGWVSKQDVALVDRALAIFTERIGSNPNDDVAYAGRAAARYEKGEFGRAISDCNEAIRLDPSNAIHFYNRGLTHAAKLEYEKAIADYAAAIRLNAKYSHAFNRRGLAYVERKEYENAIKDFDETIRLDPEAFNAYVSRAKVYTLKGKFESAINDLSQAIRLHPENAMAFFYRGCAYSERVGRTYGDSKDHDRAIRDFTEAIRLDPTEPVFFIVRGYEYKRDPAKTISDLSEAVRLGSKDVANIAILAQMLAYSPDPKSRDEKKAMEYASKACELSAWKEGWVIEDLAQICAAVGKFEFAVKWQKKALELCRAEGGYDQECRRVLELYEQKKPYSPALPPVLPAPRSGW
jgi:tetratricopeptide (TPR) repeat protein